MVKMPYRAEYTTYSGKHRNMKPNSKGSVTPQTKAQMAADRTRPMAAFLFLAVRTMASAAPAIPNIMQGKKPDMYMPRSQLTPF